MDSREALRGAGLQRTTTFAIALLVWITCSSAWAAPSETERRAARGMLEKGDRSFEAQHYDEALELYRKADAIMGVPTTTLPVAQALERLGRLAEARKLALALARSIPGSDEPAAFAQARHQAATLVIELDAAIPTVDFSTPSTIGMSAITISLDGVILREGARPVQLDPGEHELTAACDGYRTFRQRFSLARGERRVVDLKLEPIKTAVAATVVLTQTPRERGGVPTLAYVGFGIGAVGVSVGTVGGILSLSKASDAKQDCVDSRCPSSSKPAADASKSWATVSNVAFGIGLAGVAVGLVSVLTAKPSSTVADRGYSIHVGHIPQGASVGVLGRF